MANVSLTNVAKNYVKVVTQLQDAQNKCNEFVYNELNKLTDSKPTKSEYTKIVAMLGKIGRYELGTSVCEWIEKWGIEFAKTTKYKGFEIKSYNGEYISFRNGKGGLKSRELDKLKKMLDERLDAEKKMPAIMVKVGLDKLRYADFACKRSTVFDKTEHKFENEMIYSLHEFWKNCPNTKEWKITIYHDMCSHTSDELAYERRSECEYGYCKGDYVRIEANGKVLTWGAQSY